MNKIVREELNEKNSTDSSDRRQSNRGVGRDEIKVTCPFSEETFSEFVKVILENREALDNAVEVLHIHIANIIDDNTIELL